MAALLNLDDGRQFYISSLAMSIAYELIARQVTDLPLLSRWLFDLACRPAPFLDIDLRRLDEPDRLAFWRGAERAFAALEEEHGPGLLERENAFGANCLHDLLNAKRKIDAGEPPEEAGALLSPIDLTDLWFSDEELAALHR